MSTEKTVEAAEREQRETEGLLAHYASQEATLKREREGVLAARPVDFAALTKVDATLNSTVGARDTLQQAVTAQEATLEALREELRGEQTATRVANLQAKLDGLQGAYAAEYAAASAALAPHVDRLVENVDDRHALTAELKGLGVTTPDFNPARPGHYAGAVSNAIAGVFTARYEAAERARREADSQRRAALEASYGNAKPSRPPPEEDVVKVAVKLDPDPQIADRHIAIAGDTLTKASRFALPETGLDGVGFLVFGVYKDRLAAVDRLVTLLPPGTVERW